MSYQASCCWEYRFPLKINIYNGYLVILVHLVTIKDSSPECNEWTSFYLSLMTYLSCASSGWKSRKIITGLGFYCHFIWGLKCIFLSGLEWQHLPLASADVCVFKNTCFVIRSKVKIGIFLYFSLAACLVLVLLWGKMRMFCISSTIVAAATVWAHPSGFWWDSKGRVCLAAVHWVK